jgi:hypothetical protein
MMIRAALGLEFDPGARTIRFRDPRLPASFDQMVLRGLTVGQAVVDVELRRAGAHVSMQVLKNSGAAQVSMVVTR